VILEVPGAALLAVRLELAGCILRGLLIYRLAVRLFLPVDGVVIQGDGQQPHELAIPVGCGAT
jgi:hypothetical protein